jgi:putative DNA methylase
MSKLLSKQNTLPGPVVASLPQKKMKRLIDNGLLHYEASVAGFAERYCRGETSHTIHVWWARRPHTAMRALVFASLCKETDAQAEKLLHEIGLSTSLSDGIINQARACLKNQYAKSPKVLDMFGGGGTIPFEAINLGAQTYSIDANELSVFIQKCNLVYSQSLPKKNIQPILQRSGERVLSQLRQETNPLYPCRDLDFKLGKQQAAFGYIWSYSSQCRACGYRYFIIKRPWLSKKKGKNLAIVVHDENTHQTISIQNVSKDYQFKTAWFGKKGITKCPKCGHISQKIDIRDCKDELIAMIRPAVGSGKEFIKVIDGAVPERALIRQIETNALAYLGLKLPESKLPVWSGIVNPALYGINTHADFMNARQRTVCILLIKALHDEFNHLLEIETRETAIYIISLLASMIDQIVDWNCRLSMWIPQNEQVGRGFCGPGISMLWDYAEIDPVSSGPSNLNDKLKRIIKGSISIKSFPNKAIIQHAYAQNLPFESNSFDGIITDPPYYDNIYYSALADFFFAWKRLLLKKIDPDLFQSNSTDYSQELVASTKRNGTAKKAHKVYCDQLRIAIAEAARVLKPEGVFSFIYSHSSLNGWEALIYAYRPSNLIITSVQPLSIERKQRPRAMTSQAVNTCLCFVARKSTLKKKELCLREILYEIKSICATEYIGNLMDWGWSEYDAALSVFAHGVAIIANALKVKDASDIESVIQIEQIIKERVNSFKVVKRKSL